MYRFLQKFLIFISDIEQIFSPDHVHKQRWAILRAYLRLRIKASLSRWFHFTHEHFLNCHVSFPDYEIFFTTFRQVFVRHAYYFTSQTPTPTIIDCGGNIGMSVLYFKYLYPGAIITVFEPSREVLPSIRKNIADNKLLNVTLVEKAVDAVPGTATMYSRGAAACGNTLVQEIITNVAKTNNESYTVETTQLSPFVTEHVDLLKLDIEGCEGDVIRELNMSGALGRIGALTLEYHDTTSSKNNLGPLISILESHHWKVEPFSEDPHTTYTLSLRTKMRNAL